MSENIIKALDTDIKSYRITNTKYVLTILIVFLHCFPHADTLNGPSHIYSVLDDGLKMVCDAATPAFFAIASYLFFKNFVIEKYMNKLTMRFKSLVIPFVLFQIIAFIVPAIKLLIIRGQFNHVAFNDFILGINHQQYNPPLWFLITLFEFALIAPAIWVLLKKCGGRGALIAGLFFYLINFIEKTPYISLSFWMPVIIWGAYMGFREYEGKKSLWDIPWYYGLIYFLAFLLTFFFWGGDYSGNVYYTYRLIGGALIILLLGGGKIQTIWVSKLYDVCILYTLVSKFVYSFIYTQK